MTTIDDDPPKTLAERIASHKNAMNLRQFAEIFSISYKTAFEMASQGRVPAMQIGSSWRLDPVLLAKWAAEQASASSARSLQSRAPSHKVSERERLRVASFAKRSAVLARRTPDFVRTRGGQGRREQSQG